MEPHTAEIGVATGFAAGPTVRDMYRVLCELGSVAPVEVTRVRIGAAHPNDGMRLSRPFMHIRELEDYARGGDKVEYILLDQSGIERELASGGFDFLKPGLRRLSQEGRCGSYILFQAPHLTGELSYREDLSLPRTLRGLGEIIIGGTAALVAPAYGWMMAAQAAAMDASLLIPYLMIGGGLGVGGAFVADGVRQFVSDRRYLRLQIRLLENDGSAL